MDDHMQAALAFYAWLFGREFSSDEAAEFGDLVGEAGESGDRLSFYVVRHAAKRWRAVQARDVIDRSAYLLEAVTLLRDLGSPLCEWLLARYEQANLPLVEDDIAHTPEIIDAPSSDEGPTEAASGATKGYCLKCRTKREIKNQVWLTLKNARLVTRGTCPVCGTKITRIGKADDEPEAQAAFGGDEHGSPPRPGLKPYAAPLDDVGPSPPRPGLKPYAAPLDDVGSSPQRPDVPVPESQAAFGGDEHGHVARPGGLLRGYAASSGGEGLSPPRPDVPWGDEGLWETANGDDEPEPQAADGGGEHDDLWLPPVKYASVRDEDPTEAANGDDEPEPQAANGGGEPDEPEEVPETAYPLIQCEDDVVVAGEEFVLTIGLSEKAMSGVAGGEMPRPDSGSGPYRLTMRVIVPGMSLQQGESWRQTCDVTALDPYPTVDLHVTPDPQGEERLPAKIKVDYSIGSQPMGMAERNLVVIRDESFRANTEVGPQEEAGFPVPVLETAPDMTVSIWRWRPEGRLRWTIDLDESLKDVAVNDDALITDIGNEPQEFTRRLVKSLDAYDEGDPDDEAGAGVGDDDTDDDVSGIKEIVSAFCADISDKVPPHVWEVLSLVRSRVKRPPMVLIMTEDPHVPWELAEIPEAHRDPELGSVLGAQAAVARWVRGRKPPPPATTALPVKGIGIIAGRYEGNDELEGAVMEEGAMTSAYGAKSIPAKKGSFRRYMRSTDDSIIHFAVHGKYDVAVTADGLILEDGIVPESFIRGSRLEAKPFVFINACQVGGSDRVLDEYSGMASAFLHAGVSGVVAPLWSIRDKVSADVAKEFYENVFKRGTSVAEALRLQRGKFLEEGGYSSATCLAYLYYGHPALILNRKEKD